LEGAGVSAAEALNAARAVGVSVQLDGGELVLEAAISPPTAVFEALKHYKADIIALLRPPLKTDDWQPSFDERAAIIEYDGINPRVWAEALARLDPARPPCDISPMRWLRFIDDCGRFLDEGWAHRAESLGWGPLDLFGCDRIKPFARLDRAGLLWFIGGRKLLALTTDMAVISNSSGANLTFYRRWHETGDVLAWELIPHA
jgi:hypothetical protein